MLRERKERKRERGEREKKKKRKRERGERESEKRKKREREYIYQFIGNLFVGSLLEILLVFSFKVFRQVDYLYLFFFQGFE